MSKPRFWVLLPVLLALFGCSPPDREELELLKGEDPRFREIVELNSSAEREINKLNESLSEYNSTMSRKIQDMKDAYAKEQARAAQKIKTLRSKAGVNTEVFKKELTDLDAALKERQHELTELHGALEDIDGVMSRNRTLKFSEDDLNNLGQRKHMLEQRIGPLNREIEELTARVNLTRKKLKYL